MSVGSEQTGEERGDEILVAEYVLGVLSASEHARVARMIADSSELQQLERFWQQRLSDLDEGFEAVPAPSAAWQGIETRLFQQRTQASAGASFWDSLGFWRGLATGTAAVAVVAFGLLVLQPRTLEPEPAGTQLVASLTAEGSDVSYYALYDGETGTLRLTGLSGEPVAERDFELWVIHEGEPAVSLGVIPVSQRLSVELPAEDQAKVGDGTVFAVTLEPLGGAPEGVATGPIVAAGGVTRI